MSLIKTQNLRLYSEALNLHRRFDSTSPSFNFSKVTITQKVKLAAVRKRVTFTRMVRIANMIMVTMPQKLNS